MRLYSAAVLTLERLGLIRRQPGVARSIEVLLAPEDLPVLRHPEPVKSLCAEELAERRVGVLCLIL